MAKIRPFKALRPVRDKVHMIPALPHYKYKKNVLKAILEVNPYAFLNIIHPEYKSTVPTEPNSTERFEQIRDMYTKFVREGHLIQDKKEHLYVYRQTKGDQVFLGIIGAASVQEYQSDKIKKHEATLTSREAMFAHYLDVVGYNAEPVLLSYAGTKEIGDMKRKKVKERPEYEFTTIDLVKHELWILTPKETEQLVQAFEAIDSIYIADGHHRSASSAGLRQLRETNQHKHFPNEDFFLAYFLDENDIQILEFNRLVRSLNGLTVEEFCSALQEHFVVKEIKRGRKPMQAHEITMFIDNTWYSLTCKPEIIDVAHPVKSLDAEILTQYVLDPILGIKDLKSDDNIDFLSGDHPLKEVAKRVRLGSFKVGFVLYPVRIDELKRVADNNMIMPPKSTWVEPKLRSGLTIYNLNE